MRLDSGIFTRASAVLVFAAALAACDNPVKPSEDHPEAEGVVIRQGTVELARWFDGTLTGQLVVTAGQSVGPLTVRFLDHDGEELPLDDDEWLRVEFLTGADVATWQQATGGELGGTISGTTAGAATVRLHLMHGVHPSGHSEASFGPIPITVVSPI